MAFFGSLPEGSTVQITVAATDEIFDGARASIWMRSRVSPSGRTPDAALLVLCATRRFLLGTRTGREVELVRGLQSALERPVAGFYCLGEIAPIARR